MEYTLLFDPPTWGLIDDALGERERQLSSLLRFHLTWNDGEENKRTAKLRQLLKQVEGTHVNDGPYSVVQVLEMISALEDMGDGIGVAPDRSAQCHDTAEVLYKIIRTYESE